MSMIDYDALRAACAQVRRQPDDEAGVRVEVADVLGRHLLALTPPPGDVATAGRALLALVVLADALVLSRQPHLCAHTLMDVVALTGQQLLVEAETAGAVAPETVPDTGPTGPTESTGGED